MITFVEISGNAKLGPIAMSMSKSETCPDSCAFKKSGCYAKSGNVRIHWSKLDRGDSGMSWDSFVDSVSRLRRGSYFRHNVAGDLPGVNEKIDAQKLRELTGATKNKVAWTYTHKGVLDRQTPEAASNRALIKEANDKGFTVNLSANSLAHADELLKLAIAPVVTVVNSAQVKNCLTPNGARVVICPASTRDRVTCARCGLCANPNRKYVIGFPAHGNAKNVVNGIAAQVAA